MSAGDPVESMARRLVDTARRHGIDEQGQLRIESAFRTAMEYRASCAERDPGLLHPARTILILLDDAGVTDMDVLSAAALAESESRALAVPLERVREHFNARVAELAQAVPWPAQCGDELLEMLLTADLDAQRIALAERLDHARHLHLRPSADWPAQHRVVLESYLPVAERIDAQLARRLRWWSSMFERRYLNR